MTKHLTGLFLLAWTGLTQAHEGHGLPGLSHWHADDSLVWLAVAAVAGAGRAASSLIRSAASASRSGERPAQSRSRLTSRACAA